MKDLITELDLSRHLTYIITESVAGTVFNTEGRNGLYSLNIQIFIVKVHLTLSTHSVYIWRPHLRASPCGYTEVRRRNRPCRYTSSPPVGLPWSSQSQPTCWFRYVLSFILTVTHLCRHQVFVTYIITLFEEPLLRPFQLCSCSGVATWGGRGGVAPMEKIWENSEVLNF